MSTDSERKGVPSLQEAAKAVLHTNDDRMQNYIEVGEDRIYLEPKATLTEAKAQWSDALWIIEQLLKRGEERGLATLLKVGDRVEHTKTKGRIRGRIVSVVMNVEVDGLTGLNPWPYVASNLVHEREEPLAASP